MVLLTTRQEQRNPRYQVRPLIRLVVAVRKLGWRDIHGYGQGMPGVPNADTAEAPAADDLTQNPTLIQEALTSTEGQFINGIGGEIVTNIEYARSLVAAKAIHIFGTIGLSSAHRAVVDGMGPGVASLECQAAGESAVQTKHQGVVSAGADIRLEINGTKGIDCAARIIRVWIKLIQWAHAISVAVRFGDAQVHRSARKQPHAAGTNVLPGGQIIRDQFIVNGQTPGLNVKIAASLAL